jgi:CheY-like chemotaxis protein
MRDKVNFPHGFSRLAKEHKLFAGLGKKFHALFFPFNLSTAIPADTVHTDVEILIVDGNTNDASMTTNLVRGSRYAGKRVLKTSVPDAIVYLKEKQRLMPNRQILALVDLASPDYIGVDFVQELNKDENLGKLQICILTASTKQEDIQKAVELKALGYMVKPNDLTECQNLSKALDQLLLLLLKPELFDAPQFFQHSFEIATNGFPSAIPNSDNFFNTVL